MEAVLGRKDIEKIILRHLPKLSAIRWEDKELIVEIDERKLRRENIRGQNVWLTKKDVRVKPGKYSVCSTIKHDKENSEVMQVYNYLNFVKLGNTFFVSHFFVSPR